MVIPKENNSIKKVNFKLSRLDMLQNIYNLGYWQLFLILYTNDYFSTDDLSCHVSYMEPKLRLLRGMKNI